MKYLGMIAIALAAIIAAGITGLSFYLWPTSLGDHKLHVTPAMLERLAELKRERKFGPDNVSFYPGARNEAERVAAQFAADNAIQALIDDLPANPRRAVVLGHMKRALAGFTTIESEERDRMLFYLGRALDICGIESSSELFNVWRYGFPYGWFLRA